MAADVAGFNRGQALNAGRAPLEMLIEQVEFEAKEATEIVSVQIRVGDVVKFHKCKSPDGYDCVQVRCTRRSAR